jgi:HD-GYP domain-containing protein (c-di-GMP phosphodiesterase class II)
MPAMLRASFGLLASARGREALPLQRPGDPVAAMAVLVGGRGDTAVVHCVGRDARRGAFLPEDRQFLLAYARTTALAVEKMLLGEHVDGSLLDTVGSLVRTLESLESKEPSLQGHSVRVSLYAAEIGARLGLPSSQLVVTRRAGLLHDLGKLAILDPVLKKAGRLTESERQLVRRHPVIAENILRPIRLLAHEASIVRHHVERYDGHGYPDGRQGAEIPLGSRIIAVADAFDAMISPRPYRAPRAFEAARTEIARHAGTQFDPAVATAFAAIPESRLLEVSRYYRRAAAGVTEPVP